MTLGTASNKRSDSTAETSIGIACRKHPRPRRSTKKTNVSSSLSSKNFMPSRSSFARRINGDTSPGASWDQLQLRRQQLQGGQKILVSLQILIDETVPLRERSPAFHGGQIREKSDRQVFQPLENPIQFGRSKLPGPRNHRRVPPQLLKAVIAHLHAEILPGDVFNFVSFVKNDRVILRQNPGKFIVFQR